MGEITELRSTIDQIKNMDRELEQIRKIKREREEVRKLEREMEEPIDKALEEETRKTKEDILDRNQMKKLLIKYEARKNLNTEESINGLNGKESINFARCCAALYCVLSFALSVLIVFRFREWSNRTATKTPNTCSKFCCVGILCLVTVGSIICVYAHSITRIRL